MEQTEKNKVQTNKHYLRKLYTSYFTSTVCVALVLYMAGLFFMLLFNTQHISDMFRSNIKMTITVNDTRSMAEVDQLRKTLDKSDYVRESRFISKDEAAEELVKELGEDFIEILDMKNPLYSQIEIKLTDSYSNIDSIKSIEEKLTKNPAVDDVYYPKDVWNNATTVITKIAVIVLILTIILLGITIILITNSIRLQMSGDRFDIHTAKLIGASNWHITKPYLKRAFVQSLIAVLVSVGGLTLTIRFIEQIINGVFQISAFTPTLIAMVGIGIGVTMVAAAFSIRKYLHAKEDELYY
ncbi:MAG: permease-like cell division protein FtsX [Bacteroidales bacterium]|nr:permease-like cell division protein FtsX [Bacteroidales bacterium]